MNKHASNVQTMPRSPSIPASVATQLLALVLVFGRFGFPEMGIEGAGWATVAA